MKLFSRPVYFFRRAWENILENPFLNTITIGIIAVTLFLFSSFLLLLTDLNALFDLWGKGIQIVAYMEDGISQETKTQFKKLILKKNEILQVEFISKEQALKRFQKMLTGQEPLLEDLAEHNPLPESFEINLKKEFRDFETMAQMAKWINKQNGVKEVLYGQDWVERFTTTINLLKVLGGILGVLLILGSIYIISNTIKVTLFARKDELQIMQLVGATKTFIAIPFVIEGGFQGLLGGLFALTFLHGFYLFTMNQLTKVFSMPHFPFLSFQLMVFIVLGGMFLGAGVSMLSVGRFLRN